MKTYFVLIISFGVFLFSSCQEEEISVFKSKHEIYFDKFFVDEMYPGTRSADSTVASFFFYPDGTQDIEAPLVVKLSGTFLTSDLRFQLKVIEEETTALPEEYDIDKEYIFHHNTVTEESTEIEDVIKIKLHRSARLENRPEGVKLVVELVPNENVGLGQVERIRAKIILTTSTSQPVWWTDEVVKNLLGKYTEKKFKYFLNEVDKKTEMNEQLIKDHPDEAIKLVLKFKAWLSEQNPVILEEDGSLMEVAI